MPAGKKYILYIVHLYERMGNSRNSLTEWIAKCRSCYREKLIKSCNACNFLLNPRVQQVTSNQMAAHIINTKPTSTSYHHTGYAVYTAHPVFSSNTYRQIRLLNL